MDVRELITRSGNEVRRSPDLMELYLVEFEKVFGKRPNCAGCTFQKDWQRFVNSFRLNKEKNQVIMDVTFKYKGGKVLMLTYWMDGKPYRKYSNRLTEEFVMGYLTYGTEEQIAERKKEFLVLPESFREVKKETKKAETKSKEVEETPKPKKKRTPKSKK